MSKARRRIIEEPAMAFRQCLRDLERDPCQIFARGPASLPVGPHLHSLAPVGWEGRNPARIEQSSEISFCLLALELAEIADEVLVSNRIYARGTEPCSDIEVVHVGEL